MSTARSSANTGTPHTPDPEAMSVARLLLALLLTGPTFAVGSIGRSEAAEPCNVYYPLPVNGTWTYREGPQGGKPRVEKHVVVLSVQGEGDRRSALVEQSVRTPGAPDLAVGRARTTVHCDRGRIGMSVKGVAQGREGDNTSSGTVSAEIPGLPPADKLVPGYEWTSKSVIKASDGALTSVTEGRRENRVSGLEAVSVPAGRFERALKVVSIETLRQKGETRSAQQELVEWYVSGVGLVKRETRVRSGNRAATSVEVLVQSSLPAKP